MNTEAIKHEAIDFDVVLVGGGAACLASAIQLMKSAQANDMELEVALIEKGGEIGFHSVSGAILNPIALEELIPDYKDRNCPIENVVREDEFQVLTKNKNLKVPLTPRQMKNKGFYVVSLSKFNRWLGEIAEELGVNIFPGFTGVQVLYGKDQKTIVGIRTGDKGIGPDGTPKTNFEPGMDLLGKVTIFGEGARGSLMKEIDNKLGIFPKDMPQVYETGIKEVIQLPEDNYFTKSHANDIHTLGYPLSKNVPGGGFIYQMAENKVSIGFLVGLAYEDPMLDPFECFIRYKQHPFVAKIIEGGKVVEQGARTVSSGGLYTMPRLAVDGGVFVGGAAAIQNTPALKGIHVSMKSGMIAAESIIQAFKNQDFTASSLDTYTQLFEASWIKTEMMEGRNFAQALTKKGISKLFHLASQYFSGGRGFKDPMPIEPDEQTLKPATENRPQKINKKIYESDLFVDRLGGVYLSKTKHREDQPSHILLHDSEICMKECYPRYKSPCTRFCPAGVYEIQMDEKTSIPNLKLNPSNCLHCKTCDIKDPYKNITWSCPEGGQGPEYTQV